MQTFLRHEVARVCCANIPVITGRIKACRALDTCSIAADTRIAIRVHFAAIGVTGVRSMSTDIPQASVNVAGISVIAVGIKVATVRVWNIEDTRIVLDVTCSDRADKSVIAVIVFCTTSEALLVLTCSVVADVCSTDISINTVRIGVAVPTNSIVTNGISWAVRVYVAAVLIRDTVGALTGISIKTGAEVIGTCISIIAIIAICAPFDDLHRHGV